MAALHEAGVNVSTVAILAQGTHTAHANCRPDFFRLMARVGCASFAPSRLGRAYGHVQCGENPHLAPVADFPYVSAGPCVRRSRPVGIGRFRPRSSSA